MFVESLEFGADGAAEAEVALVRDLTRKEIELDARRAVHAHEVVGLRVLLGAEQDADAQSVVARQIVRNHVVCVRAGEADGRGVLRVRHGLAELRVVCTDRLLQAPRRAGVVEADRGAAPRVDADADDVAEITGERGRDVPLSRGLLRATRERRVDGIAQDDRELALLDAARLLLVHEVVEAALELRHDADERRRRVDAHRDFVHRVDLRAVAVDGLADEVEFEPRRVLGGDARDRDDDVGLVLVGHRRDERDLAREARAQHAAVDVRVRQVTIPLHAQRRRGVRRDEKDRDGQRDARPVQGHL